jgi:hypothetical protein
MSAAIASALSLSQLLPDQTFQGGSE